MDRFEQLVPPAAKVRFAARWKSLKHEGKPIAYLAAHIHGFGDIEKDEKTRGTNREFAAALGKYFAVFLPQADNPYGFLKKNSQGFEMALVDFEAIRLCNLIVALGGFGKGTSTESGYNRCRKPGFLVLPTKKEVLYHNEDWMLVNCFDAVLVPKGEYSILNTNGICPPDMKIVEFGKFRVNEIAKIISEIYRSLIGNLRENLGYA